MAEARGGGGREGEEGGLGEHDGSGGLVGFLVVEEVVVEGCDVVMLL